MTVTATVITYSLLTTTIAIIYVSAQCCCPALLQGIKGAHNKTIWADTAQQTAVQTDLRFGQLQTVADALFLRIECI